MIDPYLKLPGTELSSAQTRSATAANPLSSTSGVAFHALLERLDGQARDLRQEAGRVENTGDLQEAVDRANESLRDALDITARIVESYREALARHSGAKDGKQA
jgi:hypothetical protein